MTGPDPEEAAVPAHRPLSDWIARVLPGAPGRPPVLGPVNDGDERADARTLPRFRVQRWTRTSLVVERAGEPYRALALRAPDGSVAVELDDHGAPVAVSEPGTALVARLEEEWSGPPADAETVGALRAESLALRYFLLHRLARETLPPPELFHCLPWERVDAAARSAAALLHAGHDTPGTAPDGELRHWFTPAAASLAGPLQVLEAGLRTERPGPWFGREAGNLLNGLLAAEPARLPVRTRQALAGLAGALGEADRALHHAGRLASQRLTGLRPVGPVALTRRLDVTVAGGGRLEIELEIADHPAPPARRLTDGALCQPVVVRAGPGTRYWMALEASARTLHGFVAVPVPEDDVTVEVDLDAPPLPLRFLDRVPREEWDASLPANEGVTPSRWHQLIDELPPHHPAHAALATADLRALLMHAVSTR
ncbi:hypothetical protein [Streptomyces sp. NPDC094032]|uniref:hypothetical protein n=1 Tax=Streptomyces sp. NPDC094032 TaxID=3155308 RepID=UPI003325CF25